jgi:hypothetical protein
MKSLWAVPISSVVSLSPEGAVTLTRAILRTECGYAKLGPTALTISDRLMTPDGGIDAEINATQLQTIPQDCIFRSSITGFQIKSGANFKPWTLNSIRGELLNSQGQLCPEVERLIKRKGHYTIICTGHDLTPKQRNDARNHILSILSGEGFKGCEGKIDVLGASQIAEFAERYPETAYLLAADPVQEAMILEEWRHDSHMTNVFEESPEQTKIISYLRTALKGESKHIRILGEAGLGKTRIVLESLKDEAISPYVLYIQHGSQFGQTKLFRQLLKSGRDKPLILVIDELPETELSAIWRHLLPRCGHLKIVSMDHGLDKTRDENIERINAPYLADDRIKKILAQRVGESLELDRWAKICEGSPRVAQAIADNLCANPTDLLKPPTTIPIWTRFLHGYGSRDEANARQIECVALHLALFSRFGFEAPAVEEGEYIAALISNIDPTIGWARFQEIVQDLRERRVLQGRKTLFFVPKALHIYLWKQFWERYGRGFDFTRTFSSMPEALHTWFSNMFKYAGGADTAQVIADILNLEGIFSQNEFLLSAKGSQLLSILAEASPAAVLRLLEARIGKWSNEDLLELRGNRQQIVWSLEKIAVWPNFTVRAMQLLTRLAVNENSTNSNNSKGTLLGLFRIGPEFAATESSPEVRLPAFLNLLRAQSDAERHLGLEAAKASLDAHGIGFRIVGPEYQGLKERAKIWVPGTYNDLWQAQFRYFQTLVDETKNWPCHLRTEVCNALLNAVDNQILTPPCTELAFQVLDTLVNDEGMQPEKLNCFFWHWRKHKDNGKHPKTIKRLQILESRYTRRDLVSRFNCYVLDANWLEWEEEERENKRKTMSRKKLLVKAFARRISQSPGKFNEIRHLLTPRKRSQGLWHFGELLAQNDIDRLLLPQLIDVTLTAKHQTCLHGYLSELRKYNKDLYISTLNGFFDSESTAWLGSHIALSSEYVDDLFVKCLSALDKRWISSQQFSLLRYGRAIDHVPKEKLYTLFQQLNSHQAEESMCLLVELLDLIPLNDTSPVDSDFVFGVASRTVPSDEGRDVMRGYHWKNVSRKLIKWDETSALPLLDILLIRMRESFRLSYDSDVQPFANELVQANPSGAWEVIKAHLEETHPEPPRSILNWLDGGLGGFDDKEVRGAIADLPLHEILEWIDENPDSRAVLIAEAAPRTLDDKNGGILTRNLLSKYGQFDGVQSVISGNFNSGGWIGPRSANLKRKRDKFRRWLAAGFDYEITHWIESEIEHLDRNIEIEEFREERSRFD